MKFFLAFIRFYDGIVKPEKISISWGQKISFQTIGEVGTLSCFVNFLKKYDFRRYGTVIDNDTTKPIRRRRIRMINGEHYSMKDYANIGFTRCIVTMKKEKIGSLIIITNNSQPGKMITMTTKMING